MSAPLFRQRPIRSRKLLDSAKGQPCTLEFVGVCNHDAATTVSCHVRDELFGMSQKADDTSTVHGCSACHMYMDQGGWVGSISQTVLLRHVLRAMQRTLRNRVERGIIVIPLDPDHLSHEKPIKPRKPREQRAKVGPSRPLESRSSWPVGRKLQSRNSLRKEITP